MNHIILFNPVADETRISFTIPPWGLLSVAAPLVKEGYKVHIIDQNVELNWKGRLKELLAEKPLFCGTTSMSGPQIEHSLDFSRMVKAAWDVPVVWGGGQASSFPDQTIKHPLVDIIVIGEGDETIRELALAIMDKTALHSIKGIAYKEGGKVITTPWREFTDMDSLPEIPYHLIDIERYIFETSHAKRNFELHTSRGCPHRCAFCYNININKRKWRSMSVERIIKELKRLVKDHHIDGLNWREDNFFVDKKRVEMICEGIIKEGLKLKWHCDSRIDYFVKYDDDFIRLLKKAGCVGITFGIESGSQRILDKIHKDITVDQARKVNIMMKRHGIDAMYHFSFGYIGETNEDILETIRLSHEILKENRRAGIWPPSIFTPYPGTPLFEESLEHGFKVPGTLDEFLSIYWEEAHVPWIPPKKKRMLEDAIFIMKGAGSDIPIVRQWLMFRLGRLSRKGKAAFLPERVMSEYLQKLLRVSQVAKKSIFG